MEVAFLLIYKSGLGGVKRKGSLRRSYLFLSIRVSVVHFKISQKKKGPLSLGKLVHLATVFKLILCEGSIHGISF